MAKTRQGDLLSCSECGLIVVVDEVCGCADVAIVCCDQPMAKGKLAAGKARKKAAAKATPSSAAKAAKRSVPAKAKALAKPASPKAPLKASAKPAAKKAIKARKK